MIVGGIEHENGTAHIGRICLRIDRRQKTVTLVVQFDFRTLAEFVFALVSHPAARAYAHAAGKIGRSRHQLPGDLAAALDAEHAHAPDLFARFEIAHTVTRHSHPFVPGSFLCRFVGVGDVSARLREIRVRHVLGIFGVFFAIGKFTAVIGHEHRKPARGKALHERGAHGLIRVGQNEQRREFRPFRRKREIRENTHSPLARFPPRKADAVQTHAVFGRDRLFFRA